MIEAAIRGRLGGDPVERTTQGGKRMVTVNVAVSVNRWGSDEDTEWFGLAAFGSAADVLLRHAKGDLINAFGKMTRNRYTTKDGEQRSSWSLNVEQIVSARTVRPSSNKKRTKKPGSPSAAAAPTDFDDQVPF